MGFDKKYERPAEVDLLIGNPQKAKTARLGASTTFKGLVSLMVEEDMKLGNGKRPWRKQTFPDVKNFYQWASRDGRFFPCPHLSKRKTDK